MSEITPSIQLYIARHAQTAQNIDSRTICGQSSGLEITAAGIEQAIGLGQDLDCMGVYPGLVYSSPALRCRQTARYCLGAMGCDVQLVMIDDDLQEMSQGSWEGRLRDEIYTDAVIKEILRAPVTFRAPGGESVAAVGQRMMNFLGTVAVDADKQDRQPVTALAFGHGFATRILAGTLLGWPVAEMRVDRTSNTSLSQFTYSAAAWQVTSVGGTAIASK